MVQNKSSNKFVGGECVDNIVVALIGVLGSAFGSLVGVITSAKLTNYRLQQLENRVAEHNGFAKRMPVVEEQIKELRRIIDKGGVKDGH